MGGTLPLGTVHPVLPETLLRAVLLASTWAMSCPAQQLRGPSRWGGSGSTADACLKVLLSLLLSRDLLHNI